MTRNTLKNACGLLVIAATTGYGLWEHFEMKRLQKELEETEKNLKKELWAVYEYKAFLSIIKDDVRWYDYFSEKGDEETKGIYLKSLLENVKRGKLE